MRNFSGGKNKNMTQIFNQIFDRLDIQLDSKCSLIEELNQCNKTMFVGTNADLREILRQSPLNSSLYFGNDVFLPHSRAWVVSITHWDRQNIFYHQFQAIIHSGLYLYLQNKNESSPTSHLFENSKQPTIKPLQFSSGMLISTFLLFFLLSSTAILLFGIGHIMKALSYFCVQTYAD
jgi:hypothetical protein